MNLDFPIEKIILKIQCEGTGIAKVFIDGTPVIVPSIDGQYLKKENTFKIKFSKADPKDEYSFARITEFQVNGQSYINDFKTIMYNPDKRYHSADPIANNLYLGYIGEMTFTITQKNDPLTIAGWTLANNEFDYVKWPFKGDVYREKSFANIVRDTKFMFTGSLAPEVKEIHDFLNVLNLCDLRAPLKVNIPLQIQSWINESKRVKLSNFDALPYFNIINGNNDGINSFLNRSDGVYVAPKKYFFVGELLESTNKIIGDPYTDEIIPESDVLLEFPSPWYDIEETKKVINKAKLKGCRIALDLIWLPIINHNVELDLFTVDEIFFSMNKTWPFYDIRPGFRWSKNRIHDLSTLQWEHCTYQKLQPNIFLRMIDNFSYDYVFDKYQKTVDDICKKFSLSKTNVLWFTLDGTDRHDHNGHTSKHNHLDEFVCVKKLLDYQGKYFW